MICMFQMPDGGKLRWLCWSEWDPSGSQAASSDGSEERTSESDTKSDPESEPENESESEAEGESEAESDLKAEVVPSGKRKNFGKRKVPVRACKRV